MEPRSSIHFFFAIRSDIGKRREENQDAYGYVHSQACSMFIVADGMGGARGGATASAIAVEVITKFAPNDQGAISEESLRAAITRANSVIFAEGRKNEELSGMGTTVVVVVLSEKGVLLAHVGDSRIYRLRDGDLELLTRDHTLVKELIESGAISPDQAENHPIAHMLTRSLGPTVSVDVESRMLPNDMKPGDRFLLCSDGLYNMVKPPNLARLFAEAELEKASKRLIHAANDAGGTDNITVQLIEIRRVPASGEAIRVQASAAPIFVSRSVGYEVNYNVSLEEQPEAPPQQTEGAPPDTTPELPAEPVTPSVAEKEDSDEAAQETKKPEPEKPLLQRQQVRAEIFELQEDQMVPEQNAQQANRFKAVAAMLLGLVIVGGIAFLLIRPRTTIVLPHETPSETNVLTPGEEPPTTPGIKEAGIKEAGIKEAGMAQTGIEQARKESAKEEEQPSVTDNLSLPAVSPADQVPSRGTKVVEDTELLEPEITVVPAGTPIEDAPPNPEVARIIAEASDLTVPSPPALEEAAEEKPDQPINWAAERQAREQTQPPVSPAEPQILAPEEKDKLLEEKEGLRAKIADIDIRLELFHLRSLQQRKEKEAELEQRIATVDEALKSTKQTVENLHRRYDVWTERKKLASAGDPVKLANEVSVSSAAVKGRKEAYDMASLRYLDAVELYRENPNEDTLTSQVAALGRELKDRRGDLKTEIETAIAEMLKQTAFNISEFSIVLSNLDQHRTRLNRHIGFVKGYIDSAQTERIQLQRQLFEERTTLVTKLKTLREQLSDQDEIELRRGKAYQDLGFTN